MLKQQTSACCNLGQFSNNKTLVKLCCALLMICSILLESSTWAKIHSFIKISTSIETFLQSRKILNSDIRLTHINELSVWYWRCWMETETKQPVFILHSRQKIGHVLKQSRQNYYKHKNAWFFFYMTSCRQLVIGEPSYWSNVIGRERPRCSGLSNRRMLRPSKNMRKSNIFLHFLLFKNNFRNLLWNP